MTFLEDIQVLKKAMDNLFYKVSKKTDLAVNEIRLLLFLHQNKELDIASEIVENLMISKSHVSYTVEKLKNKGYIIKVQDEKDKKKFHLKLTEKADNILKIIKSESPPSSVLSTAVLPECSCVATNSKGCARCGT